MASQSSLSAIKLPDDVNNDEQAAVLYSPFRGKNVNPSSWNRKMTFWQKFLERTARENRLITLDINSLPQLFLRKGLTPKCLHTVIEELQRLGKVKSLEDFKKRSSWISWGLNTLVKEPLSWGVGQIFGSPKKSPTVFVWPEVLKAVADEVLSSLQSKIRQGIINPVFAYSKFEAICSEFVMTKEHFDLIVNMLVTDGKLHLEERERHGLLIKVCEREKAQVTPISATDVQIFEINEARLRTEIELVSLSGKVEEVILEARTHLGKKQRTMALHCLRRKNRLNKLMTSKSSTLHNLEEILSKIDEAETNATVVQACASGLAVLKKLNRQTNFDKADAIMDEVKETMEDVDEISTSLQGIDGKEDTALLEEELAKLLEEDKQDTERLPDISCLSLSDADFPAVPSHSPSSTKMAHNSPQVEKDDDKKQNVALFYS